MFTKTKFVCIVRAILKKSLKAKFDRNTPHFIFKQSEHRQHHDMK